MQTTIKRLISYHNSNQNFITVDITRDVLEDVESTCVIFSILRLFKNVVKNAPDVIIYLDDISTYDAILNWLKINYKGLYGWQKIQQVFLDNSSDFPSSLIEKVQSLSLPSTFEIPSNWIIYAPISR